MSSTCITGIASQEAVGACQDGACLIRMPHIGHEDFGSMPIHELGCTLWSSPFLKACRGPSSSLPITPRRRNAGAAGLRCVCAAAMWSRPPAVKRQMGLSIVRPARRGGCAWQAGIAQPDADAVTALTKPGHVGDDGITCTKLCELKGYSCCVCGVHASEQDNWDDSHWWA